MISRSQLSLLQSPHCKPTSRDNSLQELSNADGREEQVSVALIKKKMLLTLYGVWLKLGYCQVDGKLFHSTYYLIVSIVNKL